MRPANAFDIGAVKDGVVNFEPMHRPSDPSSSAEQWPLQPERRLGLALVGLGRLSVETILPALAQTSGVRLAGLVSGTPEKMRAIATAHGVESSACYSYDDLERIADNPAIQAVYIVLPNALHLDAVRRAARAGKHVLCEKPMANSSAEAAAMISACRDAGVTLMIAYRCQYDTHHRALIEIARSGRFGAIKMIEAHHGQSQGEPSQWRLDKALAGGGALPDIGIYCLNAARAITGEEPVAISAQIWSTPGDARFREVEESVAWTMRFPSGVLANLSTSYGVHKRGTLTVHMERGTLHLYNAFHYKGQQLELVHAVDGVDHKTIIAYPPGNMFAAELDHFADCIRNGQAPRTPGEEGLQDHRLMEAIYRAAAERREVQVESA